MPDQQPISLSLIQNIMQASDSLQALRAVCKPYKHEEAMRPLDPHSLHACVDDRAYHFSLHADVNGDFFINHTVMSLQRVTYDSLLHRRSLAGAAWPAGDIGIAMQTAIGMLMSGVMQAQDYWSEQDADVFVKKMLRDIIDRSAVVSNRYGTAVHIDNQHSLPLLMVDAVHGWQVNKHNMQRCIHDGTGCGAVMKFIEIVAGMTRLLGKPNEAQAFVARLGGSMIDGKCMVSGQVAHYISRQLIHDSAKRGKPVLLYVGEHHASEIVFTTGNVSPDRSLMRISDPHYAGFKTDLMLQLKHGASWKIINEVNRTFAESLGDPLAYVIGMNLLTYYLLGQSEVPRYIL